MFVQPVIATHHFRHPSKLIPSLYSLNPQVPYSNPGSCCSAPHLLPLLFSDSHFTDKPEAVRFNWPAQPLLSLCHHLCCLLWFAPILHPSTMPSHSWLESKPRCWPTFPVSAPPMWAFYKFSSFLCSLHILPAYICRSLCLGSYLSLGSSRMLFSTFSIWWNCHLWSLACPHPNLQAKLAASVWGSVMLVPLSESRPGLLQCSVCTSVFLICHQLFQVRNCFTHPLAPKLNPRDCYRVTQHLYVFIKWIIKQYFSFLNYSPTHRMLCTI